MAWRCDEDREYIQILLDLPAAQYPVTMMSWIYVVAHRDAPVQLFKLLRATGYGPAAGITSANKICGFWDFDAMPTTGTVLSAETWYHVTIVSSETEINCYLNASATPESTTAPGTYDTPSLISMGYSGFGYWLNGRQAHFRLWAAALSNAEILAEKASATAVRTANLWCSNPLTNSLADSSGLGHDFVAGSGTTTYEDGPTFGSTRNPVPMDFGLS